MSKPDLPKYFFARGNVIWVRLKDEHGEWKNKATPYTLDMWERDEGQTRENLARLIKGANRIIEAKRGAADTSGDLTFKGYAERYVADRIERKIGYAKIERTRLRKYIYPYLGHKHLDEIRPKDVVHMLRELEKLVKPDGSQALASRTRLHIFNIAHCVFESAIVDELVQNNPIKVNDADMPSKTDKDLEWRSQASYVTAEIMQLVTDPRIPIPWRVQYAYKALAGMRHGEVAALCIRHLDFRFEPLPRITICQAYNSPDKFIDTTKTDETRYCPMHPTLVKITKAFLENHWERIYGRKPTPDDLLVPTRTFRCISASDADEAKKRHFAILGLRPEAGKYRERGGHDLRGWYKTQTIEDGADSLLIRRTTHAPPKDVESGYQRFSWKALCREVAKLQFDIPDEKILEVVTDSLQSEKKAAARWTYEVTPKGLEPSETAQQRSAARAKCPPFQKTPVNAAESSGTTVTTVTSRDTRRILKEMQVALEAGDTARAKLLFDTLRPG